MLLKCNYIWKTKQQQKCWLFWVYPFCQWRDISVLGHRRSAAFAHWGENFKIKIKLQLHSRKTLELQLNPKAQLAFVFKCNSSLQKQLYTRHWKMITSGYNYFTLGLMYSHTSKYKYSYQKLKNKINPINRWPLVPFFTRLLASWCIVRGVENIAMKQIELKNNPFKWSQILGTGHWQQKINNFDLFWLFRFGHHWLTTSLSGTTVLSTSKWWLKRIIEECKKKKVH